MFKLKATSSDMQIRLMRLFWYADQHVVFLLAVESMESAFRRLSQSTLFSSVEERVLDAVFFGPNFRVRCVAQPVVMSADNVTVVAAGTASRSRPVTISPAGTPCPPFNPNANSGQQPFKAVLSYVNSSDPLHPDTMKIQVCVSIKINQ